MRFSTHLGGGFGYPHFEHFHGGCDPFGFLFFVVLIVAIVAVVRS